MKVRHLRESRSLSVSREYGRAQRSQRRWILFRIRSARQAAAGEVTREFVAHLELGAGRYIAVIADQLAKCDECLHGSHTRGIVRSAERGLHRVEAAHELRPAADRRDVLQALRRNRSEPELQFVALDPRRAR